jgi:hypothetical protein
MTQFIQMLSALKEQMNATLSRSDVLKPLAWLTGILVTGTIAGSIGKTPEWLILVLAVFSGLAVCLYFGAYIYCLVNDRDSLRSETYSLHKMAIEHGIYGDSKIGLIAPDQVAGPSRIASTTPSIREES